MPVYVYKCKSCGHQFEAFQAITAEALKECPECKGVVHRVMQAAGVIYKGNGWHCKDYGKY